MKQAELDRAVCRATGETRDRIQRMGFSLFVPPQPRKRRRRHRRHILRFADYQPVNVAPQLA